MGVGEWLIAMLFLFVGIAVWLFYFEFVLPQTSLKCDRLKNICYREIRHAWYFFARREKICAFYDVNSAEVVSSEDSEGIFYSVVLVLKNGEKIPVFNRETSSRREQERYKKQINNFIKSGSGTLKLKDSDPVIVGVVAFVVFITVLPGLAIIILNLLGSP
ncbi:MAG: hypothetical protein IKS41_04745 [Alphaproteobacteria bacterium]|nr:hypothetical protein [Alphaproteobacteria bacterium]